MRTPVMCADRIPANADQCSVGSEMEFHGPVLRHEIAGYRRLSKIGFEHQRRVTQRAKRADSTRADYLCAELLAFFRALIVAHVTTDQEEPKVQYRVDSGGELQRRHEQKDDRSEVV